MRGLDYYNLTVFEWITDALGAQGTLCGGGRYDPLIERIGGRPTPGIGFAMGVERVIELLREFGTVDALPAPMFTCCIRAGRRRCGRSFSPRQMRDGGLDVILHAGDASLKSQMKKADASGADYAVIVGEAEAAAGAAPSRRCVRHIPRRLCRAAYRAAR